jgi:hypothetical protein
MFKPIIILVFSVISLFSAANAQPVDLSKSMIIISSSISSPVRGTMARVLIDEVGKRTGLTWSTSDHWAASPRSFIAIALSSDLVLAGKAVPHRQGSQYAEYKAEGYRILTQQQENKAIIWIIAADGRAGLYGIGHVLRKAILCRNKAELAEPLDVATSPAQPIRGHQLGYRNTANSYDAWTVEQYEQYIRELVLFGSNAVENIPFEDGNNSVHMRISREEMNIRMSEICRAYDIDYWVWTPATFDLTDSTKRKAMLDKHEKFYQTCPRLDNIFFPGGDPGDNHPRVVMPFLKDLHDRLIRYHAKAGIWISLQGFTAEEIDWFYMYIEEQQPDWLAGVVSGPSSPAIAETRYRLPARYRHRQYPDITHNLRCEFPVQNWDQAYMLTIGREGTNPRPFYHAKIHDTFAPFTDGFVSYSDGCHDDVNKIIWSMRGWNVDYSVQDILCDYGRFFFGAPLAEAVAAGIAGLEQNWKGPMVENGAIETTLAFWQTLEQSNPQLSGNWRWQMLVLRAYYDAYQYRRKIYEKELERQANAALAQAGTIGSEIAMQQALAIVNKADSSPVAKELYAKIVRYCDNLYHSIGLQTSVAKYQASNAQRGCILQFVNYPLNNRWWLADEFKKISEMNSEEEKLARLEVIRTWEAPGKGSYYDNVSNIETGPRVKTTSYDACDVAWWNDGNSRARLSSQLFQTEPVLEYENLDPNGRYLLRICGLGEALVRTDGERLEPILYNKGIGEFKEFVVPRQITQDGKMRLTFDRPEETHLHWSKFSHVSDVWLLKVSK